MRHSPETAAKTREWRDRARLDLDDAKRPHATHPSGYDNVVFLAQQAVERIIKAFLVASDVRFPKIHAIEVLLDGYVASLDPDLAQAADFAVELPDYAVLARYPPKGEGIDRGAGVHALELMDRAWALFEPRIATLLETDEAPEDADEADAQARDPDA